MRICGIPYRTHWRQKPNRQRSMTSNEFSPRAAPIVRQPQSTFLHSQIVWHLSRFHAVPSRRSLRGPFRSIQAQKNQYSLRRPTFGKDRGDSSVAIFLLAPLRGKKESILRVTEPLSKFGLT